MKARASSFGRLPTRIIAECEADEKRGLAWSAPRQGALPFAVLEGWDRDQQVIPLGGAAVHRCKSI